MTPLPISIAAYSFHTLIAAGRMDVFGYLESVRYRYHLTVADIWNGLLGLEPETYLTPEFLVKVREALDERELPLANYHADGCHLWEDDPKARERHLQLALRHLDATETLGARTVRIDTGGRERAWTDEQFDYIVRHFRAFARRAADRGYRVGPENHWGTELYPDNLERLARAVDHPGFGILLHLGRWEEGDADQNDRRIAPWACHTHFDAKTLRGRAEVALRILAESGYKGCLGIEYGAGGPEYLEVAALIVEIRRAAASSAPKPSPGRGGNPLLPEL
jgi:sugar phosphate isomerase/epimerase